MLVVSRIIGSCDSAVGCKIAATSTASCLSIVTGAFAGSVYRASDSTSSILDESMLAAPFLYTFSPA